MRIRVRATPCAVDGRGTGKGRAPEGTGASGEAYGVIVALSNSDPKILILKYEYYRICNGVSRKIRQPHHFDVALSVRPAAKAPYTALGVRRGGIPPAGFF
ncbi:MAG: hypothetical protein OXU79_09160 [Gemmatimonadota bacterium]|nr:hypothetical protein [Gemmatimonadota bacterium]